MDIQALAPPLLMLSLSGLIVAVGLDAEPDDLVYLFRRPRLLAKAVLAVNVLVPLAALFLVALFPLTPVVKVAILLMAVSPLPPFVPGRELKVGAEKRHAYGVYAALIVLALVIVPATIALLGLILGIDAVPSVQAVVRQILLTAILPLALGVAVRRFAPAFAARAMPVVNTLSGILLLLVAVPLLVVVAPAMLALTGNGAVVAMALTVAAGLAAGHWLGGPDRRNRAALATAAALRHPGLAIAIAEAREADKAVTAAILGMLIVGAVVVSLYGLRMKPPKLAPT